MERILILDFGSQYTMLIARRIREMNVYCEIVPFNRIPAITPDVKGIILSGSPSSVAAENAPQPDLSGVPAGMPILGICYGAQWLAWSKGGNVANSGTREYGRAILSVKDSNDPLLKDIPAESQVWMSHGDTINSLPADYRVIASTATVGNAAFRVEGKLIWGIQFHAEVHHSEFGKQILRNYVLGICGCAGSWTPASFIESTVASLREQIGSDKVVLGLSGGVDSSVAALLLHKAIGDQLHCIFVDSGLLRKDEFSSVLASYKGMGLNVKGVEASDRFFADLAGLTEPERKRKAIGKDFIEVFNAEAKKIKDVRWLAQGTIYPDVIESSAVPGASATIKSHHNVGGLPKEMELKVVEPLRLLFKDEVRRVGKALGLDPNILGRHPFPGPGLGIRVLGEVTREKVAILQEADAIYIGALKRWNLYDDVWQAATILLPIKSVGVMGDERTYEYTIVLRAVTSVDGMTADWAQLPYDFLAEVSNAIIRDVKGVNRVVYDICSKPPATIEWE
ncbi:MAG: glutamine-hydrolyzing GMP synthase [Bacteroidales bacterium]|nr:glutamine-hydrolyzing GMP synthase [Bacteroidales bacterium]